MAAEFRVPGPCTVWFGGKSLGISKAGINIRIRTTWTPVTDDEHGTEPVDFIFTGKAAQVEAVTLDTTLIKAAGIWDAYGGLLMGVTEGLYAIGAKASALSQALSIVERQASYTWAALRAVPIDPDQLALSSTSELLVPVTFLIVPDANGKLFSTFPSYIVA